MTTPPDDVVIVRAGAERIGDLQPLWESLHRHHAAVAPDMRTIGRERRPSESWRVRRAHYEHLLAEPDAFILIAELAGRPVGYALVRIRGSEETWETGPVAELETLAVLDGHRGRTIGNRLVEAMFDGLRDAGVAHWSVAVITSNADAIRFYERLPVQPYLVTYIGNVPPTEGA
jgi:ribosomal protein S18 acetylase RimI-like enzyme